MQPEDEEEEDLKDLIAEMELEEDEASTFREAIATLPAVLEAAQEAKKAAAKKAAEKAAKKQVTEQAPFNGLLEWVRSNLGDDMATAIERARGDTIERLRVQLSLKDEALAGKDEALADKDAALRDARARIEALEGGDHTVKDA
eukprot:COSAG04_NODE_1029_length_8668_cov_5.545104_2_plen_144_part_00